MKLLMTADAVGGVWTYALRLCAGLAEHGVDIVLATLGPRPSASQCAHALRIGNVRLVHREFRLEWMQDSQEDVHRAGNWLLELAAKESVDLVHLNGYAHAVLPWPRPAMVVAHSCVGSWWQAVHGAPAPAGEWGPYLKQVAAGLAAADCVVAPTAAFLRQLTALYGALPRTRVIHNGCFAAPFVSEPAPARLPIVLACGRLWDEAKRLRILDGIARDLPWRVYIAGESTSPEGATIAARQAVGLGQLSADELGLWMQRASIFVHPACYEPFGLSVLEAALAGCALLLANLSSLRELWDEAAVFVDAGDEQALRAALFELIHDRGRRLQLGRAARARAARFSTAAMARAYAELYRELLPQSMSDELSSTEIAAV